MLINFFFPFKQKPIVLINNQKVNIVKKQKGRYFYKIDDYQEQVINLKILSVSEFDSPYWFIFLYLFFLISFLGLFDKRLDKQNVSLKYEANITIKENDNSFIEIVANKITKKTPKGVIKTKNSNLEIEEIISEYQIDKKLQNRYRILKTFKILTWLALIIALVILVINIL